MTQTVSHQLPVILKLHKNSSWHAEPINKVDNQFDRLEQALDLLAPLAVMDQSGNILRAVELLEKAQEEMQAEDDEEVPFESLALY